MQATSALADEQAFIRRYGGFVLFEGESGADCREMRGSIQRTEAHASRIQVGTEGCKTVAMRFSRRLLLLNLGDRVFILSHIDAQPGFGAYL